MKVVYFDYWTEGIHNFVPIDIQLKRRGIATELFHVGSFNNPNEPQSKNCYDINCNDIKKYDTTFVYSALKKISPDVVISLNTTYIFDRVLVLSCRALGIKSIFMMHGDRATGREIEDAINSQQFGFIKKLSKALKYFKLVIPNYLYSSWSYSKKNIINLVPFRVLIKVFLNPSKSNYYPPHANDIIHDKCLIYANKYKEYYRDIGYEESQIKIVGNPKNDKLFELVNTNFPIDSVNNEKIKELIRKGTQYALYLEDSYPEQGMCGWTYSYLIVHLNQIAERLKKEKLNLIVKLHPTTDLEKLSNLDEEIIVVKSDLEHLVHYSKFCIGHTSSTVNLAILMNKPVLVPKWGKSQKLPDYYVSRNVAIPWLNINDNFILSINKDYIDKYIDENITITKPIASELILKEIIYD